MIKLIASTLFAALVGTLAVLAMPPALVARTEPVQPSFDIAMPTPPQSVQATVVTAVDTDAVHAE